MSAPAASVAIQNPYPGLRPFEVEEFESFFGRDRQIDELLGRLRDRRFVAVVGLSGSGKSSLIRAGLIHRLQVGHLTNAGSRWRVALFRPGSQPIEAMAAALDETIGELPDRAAELRKSTQGVLHSTRDGREPRENLLLVVDQFEEIFRFQRDRQLSDRDAAHFVDLLLAAEQDLSPDYRVYVVLTMRTDYLGDCAQFEGLPEALNRNQYLVPRLTREQTREAIEGPAALTETEIASDLLQTLLVESSEGHDTLPLLQHALTRLWEKRELAPDGGWQIGAAHYWTLGGMANALNDHADKVLAVLSRDGQELAKKIFRELTEVGQGRDQRRPQRLSQLVRRTGANLPEVTAVVDHFLKASLLSSPDPGRADDWVVDISHESLIRQWETLRNWAAEEAEDRDDYLYIAKRVERGGELLTGADLTLALEWRERKHSPEWAERYGGDFAATVAFIDRSLEEERKQRLQKEEQQQRELRRARQLQRIFGAVAVVFLMLLVLAWFFYRESKARELAALATDSLGEDSERSILLGMQSVNAALPFGQTIVVAEQALHQAVLSSQVRLTLTGNTGYVLSVAWSPDGKRLATGSVDGTARVWDAASGQELLTLKGQTGSVSSMAWSPDGKRLATGSWDQTVKVWDAASWQELLTLKGHTGRVVSVAWSPDGKRLATGSEDQTAKVWDAESGQELLTLEGHTKEVSSVAWSPDGKRLATSGLTAKVWDAASGQELLILKAGAVSSVAWSPDGKRLATGSYDQTAAKVWDAESGQELLTLKGHDDDVTSVAWSPDGKRLATGSWDHTARVWDAASGQELLTLKGHNDRVYSVAWSPDGKRLATGSWDHTAKVWDAASGQEVLTLTGHTLPVSSVAWSPDGKQLATGSWDRTARVWDAASGQEVLTLTGHTGSVSSVAWSPDGKRLATGSWDQTAKVWDAASGHELLTLTGQTGSVSSVAWSPDGKRLATGSWDQTAKVWDAASWQELLTLKGHTGRVVSVAWSPDGKRLATGSEDQTAKVWDAESGQELLTLKGHIEAVTSVAWSPDGKRLATGSLDQTAKVWDAASGQEVLTLKGHTGRVVSVSWSPDGKRLATGSWDFTAKVWDAASGQEFLTLKGHNDRANGVAWSPDGKRLATGSYDKTVQIYAMDPRGLLDLARCRVTRNFTPEECKRYFQSEKCPPLPAQKSSVVVQNGYVELNPIPWAEVLAVKKASGEVLKVPKVPGQTPLRFSLPPGDYVIQVKDSNERVTPIIVKVEAGRHAVWHDTLPGFDPDKAVNELLK